MACKINALIKSYLWLVKLHVFIISDLQDISLVIVSCKGCLEKTQLLLRSLQIRNSSLVLYDHLLQT